MKDETMLDDTELKVRGIDALHEVLGPADAHRFLSLLLRAPTDYVEISNRIYKDQTVDEIFDRVQEEQ